MSVWVLVPVAGNVVKGLLIKYNGLQPRRVTLLFLMR